MKNRHGFTLIELVIIVSIVGVLVAIAVPTFMNSTESSRLRGDAQNIYSLLQVAKMQAVRDRSDVRVVFDTTTPQRIQVFSNDGVKSFVFSGKNSFGHGAATTGVGGSATVVDGVTHGSNEFNFNSRGEIDPPSGYVYVQNPNNQTYAIGTLSPTGIINLRRWSAGVWK